MKKRIFSMALALMMMLSICAVSVGAEETTASTNLVYYDLQEQEAGTGGNTGSNWSPRNGAVGGIMGHVGYSRWNVIDEEGEKTLEIKHTTAGSKLNMNLFAFRTDLLKEGDYSVPLRKVTMNFNTVENETKENYDYPAKLWFNLWVGSVRFIKYINEASSERFPISETLMTALNEYEDEDLILFFWDMKGAPFKYFVDTMVKNYTGEICPIAKIGTRNDGGYTDVEYTYELDPDNLAKLVVKELKIGSTVQNTLLDGTTPVSGIDFEETYVASDKPQDWCYPGGLKKGYSPVNRSTGLTDDAISVMGVIYDSSAKKGTEIYFKELKYEGLRDLEFEAEAVSKIVDDKKATATITVTNHPGIAFTGTAIFAVYEGDKLIGVSVDKNVSAEATAGATYTNTLTVTNDAFADTSKTFTYKVFLLDSMENLVPITGEVSGDL